MLTLNWCSQMAEILAYRMARQHVNSFEQESELMKLHHEAMDYFDGEAFLQLGIDAFHWLVLADETIRRTVLKRVKEYDPAIDEALKQLLIAWLRPCKLANEWIDLQNQRGYQVANFGEFRECEEEALAIVESWDHELLTETTRELRDKALAEHGDGTRSSFRRRAYDNTPTL